MSDELSAAERVVEEVLIDLMTERVMSERCLQVYKHHPREDCQLLHPLLELDHPDHPMRSEPSTGMTS
jgi:hypothetical protein